MLIHFHDPSNYEPFLDMEVSPSTAVEKVREWLAAQHGVDDGNVYIWLYDCPDVVLTDDIEIEEVLGKDENGDDIIERTTRVATLEDLCIEEREVLAFAIRGADAHILAT